MAGTALSGLASGVDTASIVSQLMALDRQQLTRMQLRQTGMQAQATDLKDVKTKLTALKTAAADLGSATTWASTQSATSSDATRVQVTRTGGAPIGGHSFVVDRLASSAQKTFNYTPSASETTLSLGYSSGGAPVSVKIAANATAAEVAATLNGSVDAPVYAAVVNGNQLVLSSRKTGAAGDFDASGGGLGAPVSTVAGQKARYSVDGGAVKESDTNVLESEIPGLRIALKGVTNGAVSLTVEPPAADSEKIKTKVQAFIDAYNTVITTARGHVDEKSIANPTTATQAAQGKLFGDTALNSMLSKLRRTMSDTFSAVGNGAGMDELRELGISTGSSTGSASADAKMGKLTLDAEKFATALTNDPVSVRRLLGGVAGAGGLAQTIGDLVTKDFSKIIDQKVESAERQNTAIASQMTAVDKRLTAKEERLKAQFAAMETALGNAQSQQSWLSGQIAALG